jgi:hypothetical protein
MKMARLVAVLNESIGSPSGDASDSVVVNATIFRERAPTEEVGRLLMAAKRRRILDLNDQNGGDALKRVDPHCGSFAFTLGQVVY